jgi:uncharacterized protein YecT (DUF1311 family)
VARRIGLALSILVLTGWSSATARAALSPPTLPVKASPNSVASFACPTKPVSTLDIEACEGRKLLRLDRQFNNQAALLWSVLDPSGRRMFIRAQAAWLTYRNQHCQLAARAYLGGTASGLVAGQCQTALTAARVEEVTSTLSLYCQGKVRTGRYRQCPHS